MLKYLTCCHCVFALATLCALQNSGQIHAQTLAGTAGTLPVRDNAMNVRWGYNWGADPPATIDDAHFEFVPMIWRANPANVQANQIDKILAYKDQYNVEYILGFNEPELPTQANMTVQQALDTWDVITDGFAGSGIKLVSPAVSGGGAVNNWLAPFMQEVETRNADSNPVNDLQVDAIAYHHYTVGYTPQTEANKILTTIDQIWADYGLPIWLTEFAGTSFSLDNPVHSVEERTAFNTALLEILIPEFEARPYVERYAWWQFGAFGRPYSALSTNDNGVYTPTTIGDVYGGTLHAGESLDFDNSDRKPTDVQYLRGGTISNTGAALTTALRAIDSIEGIGTISGTADWGVSGGKDSFVRVRSGATLQKSGNNTISFSGNPIYNDGDLLIQDGILSIENGAEISGAGSTRTVVGSTVSFGASADTSGSSIRQDLELAGGRVRTIATQSGSHTISGTSTLDATTTFSVTGDLTITGTITAGSGGSTGIVKTNSGTLYVNGNNSYGGPTVIQSGKLTVASPVGSATGSGAVEVGSTATLGGIGSIAGPLTAQGGGTVAPGVSQSNLGIASVPAISEGVVVDAIDFDFTGVQDDAPLTQTSALNPAMELVFGLDFGPGVEPRGAANNGNEFNVMGFSTGDNYGAAGNAGDYLTFTVAPVEGLAMVIYDVTFELRRNGSGAAQEYVIASSIDGFTWADRWGWLDLDGGDTSTHLFTATNPGSEPVADQVEIRITGMDSGSSFGNTHFYAVSLDASFVSDPNHIAFQPTGILELGGDYTQLDFATLEIELGGTSNADPDSPQYDQLQVAGDVALDGTLDLSFVEGFVGSIGQTFDIVTGNSIAGAFDTIIAPQGMDVSISYLSSIVRVELISAGLPGDFNDDGVVDAADYTVWRDNLGANDESALSGNGNGSNGVDQADYQLWAYNLGTTSPGSGSATIPEPATLVLLILGAAVLANQKRK